jgi:hypothetical protein
MTRESEVRMKPACVLSALALLCLGGSVAAQARPDYSGRWTSVPDPATQDARGAGRGEAGGARAARGGRAGGGRGAAAGDMGSGWASTITITQDAAQLVVEYTFFTRGDMQPPLRFEYALNGSPTRHGVRMGRGVQEQSSTAMWEGDRLVLTTLHTYTNPQTGEPATAEVRRTLSLATPDSLVVESVRAGVLGGPPSTTRTVYRRM